MPLPAIGAAIARGVAAIGRVAASAGQVIARGVSTVSQGATRIATSAGSKFVAASHRTEAFARNTEAFARKRFRHTAGAFRSSRGAIGEALSKRKVKSPRRKTRRKMPTVNSAWRRAVRQSAIETKKASRRGENVLTRMFEPKTFLGKIAKNYGAAEQSFREGNNAQGTMHTLKIARSVGGPVAGGVLATAVALATMPKLIKEFGAALIESRRNISEVSAPYAGAMARLDTNRTFRNVQFGNQTGKAFSEWSNAQDRLEKALLPAQVTLANIVAKVLTKVELGVATLMTITDAVAKAYPPIKAALDEINENTGHQNRRESQALSQISQRLASGEFTRRNNPPIIPPVPPVRNPN